MAKKKINKQESINQINHFFEKASNSVKEDPNTIKRYVKKARRIAMRLNLKLPPEIRKRFCRKCYSFFVSSNCKIRIKRDYLVKECLNCGNIQRYKIKKIKKN